MSRGELRPNKLHGDILVPAFAIEQAIKTIGQTIAIEHRDQEPLVVGLLTGAYTFTGKLVDAMVETEPMLNPGVDFLRVDAYGAGQQSRKPRILGDLSKSTEVKDRYVIVADDITDTGESMDLAVMHMYDLGASVVKTAVMLDRVTDMDKPIAANYIAVRLRSKKWVVGMGLDGPGTGKGGGRSLPYIAECLVQPEEL